ncbi:hypothetical protein JHD49_06760 [Sulfurimonas sp. SAG-AH-194-C21]|nr:hypothetical protein [Sulfurimonas sp. SAG-AH-194-C21]MDF1883635.1 hypothetical protein [Sulfurimonas sp. SAG-AH-194-C21]
MIKSILLLITITLTLNAQNFSKRTLQGEWELSSAKRNQAVSFGKYIGQTRNGTLTLLFNQRGLLKVLETDEVYNYEVIRGELKIYQIRVYGNNYQVKSTKYYDLFKIIGSVDGCLEVKVIKKRIPGFNSRYNLKMCKLSNYPQPTYQESVSKYRF